jgi:cell division protein FtsW (lipid II flippase)
MKNKPNQSLLIIISLLVLIGILALATATVPASLKNNKDAGYFLFHQLVSDFCQELLQD